ncbi:uncharacterized protein LOC108103385 [Drosophila eugracilis]|uniref:uncharacterized protein LOC108103385 n=1 Tax=Drosophila eugracilis TaxID=29029 RepID=UPI001BDA6FEA|nr:uncharacterized protein LOC108103385 [Drosophila eugracilis]
MAFLGRVNSQGTLIDCEVFSGRAAKIQPQQNSASQVREDETNALLPKTKGSRTYIKTYGEVSLLRSMGSPSTVRYVGSSVSPSEINSLDETETSTLRCCSVMSSGTLETLETEGNLQGEDLVLQTESRTLCLDLGSPSSSDSSSSSSSSSTRSNSSDKDSTTSMCSWEEAMSRGESMLASQEMPFSLSLPSLCLGSNGGSPPLTYTRHLDPIRVERSADEAYENWLSGKRRQCQYKLQAEQAELKLQREQTAMRQQLAKEKYEQWCQQKSRQASTTNTSSSKPVRPAQIPSQKTPASVQSHLQKWELQKLRLVEQRRMELRRAEQRRQQERAIRRQQAEQAFSRWMSNVDQRPKPVPSSQGIKSLRGTVSDIFVNPNQWVD